jgi:hypothetical protein
MDLVKDGLKFIQIKKNSAKYSIYCFFNLTQRILFYNCKPKRKILKTFIFVPNKENRQF